MDSCEQQMPYVVTKDFTGRHRQHKIAEGPEDVLIQPLYGPFAQRRRANAFIQRELRGERHLILKIHELDSEKAKRSECAASPVPLAPAGQWVQFIYDEYGGPSDVQAYGPFSSLEDATTWKKATWSWKHLCSDHQIIDDAFAVGKMQ